ncbi:hypothetical protein Tco_1415271 [Tanacetum coccineum]
MARQCTKPKRPRNSTWHKEKAMLAEDLKSGVVLDEEQMEFLADNRILLLHERISKKRTKNKAKTKHGMEKHGKDKVKSKPKSKKSTVKVKADNEEYLIGQT